MLTSRELNLLCLASHASYFIISTEALPQTNDIEALSRLITSELKTLLYLHKATITALTKG